MGFLRRSQQNAGFENLDIVSYRSDFVNSTEHTLVDVRTMGEFRNGHLPGAINIPLDQIANRYYEIDSSKPIIVVCASGNRSRTASKKLAEAGLSKIYNLKGGTMSWMMAGLPLES